MPIFVNKIFYKNLLTFTSWSMYKYKLDTATVEEVLKSAKTIGDKSAIRVAFEATNNWFDVASKNDRLNEETLRLLLEPTAYKKINDISEKIGYGMILLQLAADLSNPEKTNLEATWNLIKNIGYEIPSAGGPRVMSIGVFAIDYSLNSFATAALEQSYEINNKAYHIYYNKKFKERRKGVQWYAVFKNIADQSKTYEETKKNIDTELNNYVNEIWKEEDTAGIAEAYQEAGITSTGGAGLNEEVKKKISNNYKVELLQYLQPVLMQVRKKIQVEQSVQLNTDVKNLMREYNKPYTLQVEVKGAKDKISKLPVKLVVNNAEYQKDWQGTTDKDGIWKMNFTLYGYCKIGAPKTVKLSILDENGKVKNELQQSIKNLKTEEATTVTFSLEEKPPAEDSGARTPFDPGASPSGIKMVDTKPKDGEGSAPLPSGPIPVSP